MPEASDRPVGSPVETPAAQALDAASPPDQIREAFLAALAADPDCAPPLVAALSEALSAHDVLDREELLALVESAIVGGA